MVQRDEIRRVGVAEAPERVLGHALDLLEERPITPVRRREPLPLQDIDDGFAIFVRLPLAVFDDLAVVEDHQIDEVVRLHGVDELPRHLLRVGVAPSHRVRRVERDEPRGTDARLALRLAPLDLVLELREVIFAVHLHEQARVALRKWKGAPQRAGRLDLFAPARRDALEVRLAGARLEHLGQALELHDLDHGREHGLTAGDPRARIDAEDVPLGRRERRRREREQQHERERGVEERGVKAIAKAGANADHGSCAEKGRARGSEEPLTRVRRLSRRS